VVEGPRRRWSAIALDVPAREDSGRFREALPLEPGGWASPRVAGEAVTQALRAVVDHGWPYAQLGVGSWEEDSSGVALRLEAAIDQQVQDTVWVRTRWGAGGRLALTSRERIEARFDEERVVQGTGGIEEADIQTTTLAFERAGAAGVFERRGTRARISA